MNNEQETNYSTFCLYISIVQTHSFCYFHKCHILSSENTTRPILLRRSRIDNNVKRQIHTLSREHSQKRRILEEHQVRDHPDPNRVSRHCHVILTRTFVWLSLTALTLSMFPQDRDVSQTRGTREKPFQEGRRISPSLETGSRLIHDARRRDRSRVEEISVMYVPFPAFGSTPAGRRSGSRAGRRTVALYSLSGLVGYCVAERIPRTRVNSAPPRDSPPY